MALALSIVTQQIFLNHHSFKQFSSVISMILPLWSTIKEN